MVYLKKKKFPNSVPNTPKGIINIEFYVHYISFKFWLEAVTFFPPKNRARNASMHHYENQGNIFSADRLENYICLFNTGNLFEFVDRSCRQV